MEGNITPCGITNVTVTLGPFSTENSFNVVDHLSVPTILGCDFLREHGFVLDFKSNTFHRADSPDQALPLELTEMKSCGAVTIGDDCPQAIPVRCADKNCIQFVMPTDVHPELESVIQEFEELFSKQLGQTNVTRYVIETGEAMPIKVPP